MKKAVFAIALALVGMTVLAGPKKDGAFFSDLSEKFNRVEELRIPDSELTPEQVEWRSLGYPLSPIGKVKSLPKSLWFKPVKLYTQEDIDALFGPKSAKNEMTESGLNVPSIAAFEALKEANEAKAKANRENPIEYTLVAPPPLPRGAQSEPWVK